MMRFRLYFLVICFVFSSFVEAADAQTAPNLALIQKFDRLNNELVSNPATAFDLADEIFNEVSGFDKETSFAGDGFLTDLAIFLAHSALEKSMPERALSYLESVVPLLTLSDESATKVFDLIEKAYLQLGNQQIALTNALQAYNAAEARLGPENPVLLERLKVLEPRVREFLPALLPQLMSMTARIKAAQTTTHRGVEDQNPQAVTVWFGTNRNTTGSLDPIRTFGVENGDLTVGRLTVTIPPNHESGRIEKPEGWFQTQHFDPDKHIVLANLEKLAQKEFLSGCCDEGDKLLFVHGYNVSFHAGALRAAQLSFDLEFRGQMLYYSWPSQGTLLGYLADSRNVGASTQLVEDFLELATRDEGKLHVIAHSMGNRYFLSGLEAFAKNYQDRKLGKIILAAPDVDKHRFAKLYPKIKDIAESVTLYAANNDIALIVSRTVNGNSRLGDLGGKHLVLDGLDVIDSSSIEADSLGHSYFGNAPQVLSDIVGLVRMDLAPNGRCGVAQIDDSRSFWKVQAEGCSLTSVRAAADLVRLHGADALDRARAYLEDNKQDDPAFWREVLKIIEDRL